MMNISVLSSCTIEKGRRVRADLDLVHAAAVLLLPRKSGGRRWTNTSGRWASRACARPCLVDPGGELRGRQAGQALEGSFSAVSTPNFAIKISFETSRRDPHERQLSKDFRSQNVV